MKKCYTLFINNIPSYWNAFVTTISLAFLGTLGAFLLSLWLLYLKGIRKKERISFYERYLYKTIDILLYFYIFFVKSVPMMLQAMLLYWGTKIAGFCSWLTPFQAALFILIFNSCAMLAEFMIKNMSFFDPGQIEASLALGMNRKQTFKCVICPQLVNQSLLRIINEFILNIKDICVFYVITVVDIFTLSQKLAKKSYDYVTPYINASLIYIILIFISYYLLKKLETKLGNKNA
ncbi:ABC-type amino acid transport system, permease component [Aster yellows witches'-broom phytoplasma AYWB]|uniref:ABC-type amino acid transport system, permease component n=2 Tax=16SrI (Aster yellows group) TaxID=3042590 RepID=Q2NJL1_AYWBP|nr:MULTISPECIES: ABC transporter permease subunit [16SrI (Aster yellows group)]ABC65382.1 ABC-type amino acid transport system, permease component [Aster yellows witches'-broom phytoplasma AYWB]PEH36331.1 amino acid ABC transporter permease [New Jersey aster yellows phytoplasma]